MAVPGKGASRTTLDYEQGPVAVMLDLVNPVSAFGRLVGQARKLRSDKAKAGHASYLIGTGVPGGVSQRSGNHDQAHAGRRIEGKRIKKAQGRLPWAATIHPRNRRAKSHYLPK